MQRRHYLDVGVALLTLVSVVSTARADAPKLTYEFGLRAAQHAISGKEYPPPMSPETDMWGTQHAASSVGADAGITFDVWSLSARFDHADIEYECYRFMFDTYDPEPRPYPTNHDYYADCRGRRLRAGIFGRYVLAANDNVKGLVGIGASWLRQYRTYTELTQYRDGPWVKHARKQESQGFALTLLDFELRWQSLKHVWLGPTMSFGWLDDRFGSRYEASGGIRLGFE